ncbi:MAG: phage holin family protein [Urechidicola sp.]|nr:phage holin family protein [Urechidicola sp.]
MNLILRILLTTIAVLILQLFLPGITIPSYGTAIWVAIVLGVLNVFVKPILIIFTLPATIFTLGLFLFVINAIIIMLVGFLVDGFEVSGFWYALLFSILLSFLQSVFYSFIYEKKQV